MLALFFEANSLILFENSFFQNVLSGTIVGFVVYIVQKLSDKSAKSKENISNSIVGKKELKILSEEIRNNDSICTIMLSNPLFNKNEALLQNIDLTKRYQFNAPKPHENILENAQWLGGMGAGAWFTVIPQNATSILVKRQQKDGFIDYESIFEVQQGNFHPTIGFKVAYGSNYQKTILVQNNRFIFFNRK